MFGCENIIRAEQDVVIEDNYIHDPIPYDRARGIRTPTASRCRPRRGNITIRHNTIYGGYMSQHNFGNSAITSGQVHKRLRDQQPHGWWRAHLRCPERRQNLDTDRSRGSS